VKLWATPVFNLRLEAHFKSIAEMEATDRLEYLKLRAGFQCTNPTEDHPTRGCAGFDRQLSSNEA